MAWVTFDESKLKGGVGLTGPELNAVRTAALPDGVTDKLTEVLTTVIREVRGRVKACAKNSVVGEDGTIPDECLAAARARAVYELGMAIPGKQILTPQREDANKQAIAFLKDVAACQVAIEPRRRRAMSRPRRQRVEVIDVPARRASRSRNAGL
jgi:hypothetical protein